MITNDENAQVNEQSAEQLVPQVNQPIEKTPKKERNPKALTLSEAIATSDDLPETEFIWSGINKKGVGFVFGQSKSGKTTLCENLGMSLAAGQDTFLGTTLLKAAKPTKVLFISLEERYNTRLSRNKKQAKALDDLSGNQDWRENYLIVNQDLPLYIAGAKEWAILDEIIKEHKPELVLIDSLTRLSGEEIEKSKVASNLMRELHKLGSENDITLIVIHHTAKQAGKPLAVDSLAGSRVIIQEADFAIGINRTKSGTRYIKEVAFRYKPEDEDNVLTFTLDKNQWLVAGYKTSELELTEWFDRRQDDTNQLLVYNYLKKVMKLEGVKVQALLDGLVQPKIISKATLYTSLRKLIEQGKLITGDSKGIYKLAETPPK